MVRNKISSVALTEVGAQNEFAPTEVVATK